MKKHPKANKSTSRVLGVRINQVEQLLAMFIGSKLPADVCLTQWMRQNRKAGSRDRSEVANAFFDILRNLRLYNHLSSSGFGPETRRLAILGLFASKGFSAIANSLKPEESMWLDSINKTSPNYYSPSIRFSFPDWAYKNIKRIDDPESLMMALNQEASLDLRVNTLKSDRKTVLETLSQPEFSVYKPVAGVYSPWSIKLIGRPPVNQWELFKKGVIEVQDEGSQVLSALLAPRRGEMIIDYCAGAGGKTLAIGAMMRSTGRLYAFDISARRLSRARPRIARSGLSNVVSVVIQENNDKRVQRLYGKADRVLVDAPCTGFGTLRRNPDLKWRISDNDLKNLVNQQANILDQAAMCVKKGGRLVYATCSIFSLENELQIDGFLKRNKEFRLLPAGTILKDVCPSINLNGPYLQLRPDTHGTDGFFAAALERIN